MRRKRFIVASVVAIAIAVTIYLIYKKFSASDDEAPIIVKNGSLDVIAGDDPPKNHHWKWDRPGGGGSSVFVHEPQFPHGSTGFRPFLVYVIGNPSGGCKTMTAGDTVTVTYSDNFAVKFTSVQQGSSGKFRTQVEPVSGTGLNEDTSAKIPTLRHGAPTTGFISSITVGTATPCTFSQASDLDIICISPDDPRQACEDL